MNLWAKSLGRLTVLAVALFFFSCEDETSLLGLKNPKPKLDVTFVEIPLESSVLSIDSVYTDNKAAVGNVLVGQYADNRVGDIRSEAYIQFLPSTNTLIPAGAVFDSLTVQFRFSFYSYGIAGKQTERFTIHEITGDSISRMFANRYKASSTIAYNPTPMAETFVSVDYDSLKKQYALEPTKQDTLTARARLSDEMGQQIFNFASIYEFKKNNPDFIQFISAIKGIVLVPSQTAGILGIKVTDALSRVTLHYHTVADNTTTNLTKTYGFSIASFSNIKADRSSTELSALTQHYQTLQPASGLRYLQSGTPIVTKLDLTKFYAFADTVDNVIITEAELIVGGVESPLGLDPHSSVVLKPMREDNQFYNFAVAADSSAMRSNFVFPTIGTSADVNKNHYFVQSDIPSQTAQAATLGYSKASNSLTSFLTLFTQALMKNKEKDGEINPTRLKYLAMYPIGPSVLHTVNRTVFAADQVKLRIYYTRPTITTP